MDRRTCSRCKVAKPVAAFHAKGPHGWHTYCIPCQAAYRRQHYLANKEKYLQNARRSTDARRALIREMIQKAKEGKRCADCGRAYPPWVLQFDHLDASDKESTIANMVTRDILGQGGEGDRQV